ncbi:Fe-S protein [Pasteurellaceae bacterium Macca]|nr:Fe-S protein [Pasteurellaceae bacterium Macca]
MQVTELNLYPIKSTARYGVKQAFVQPQGLNFDREFMITDLDGKFMTARQDPELFRLSAFPLSTGLAICHQQTGEPCLARYADFIYTQPSEVWGTVFPSFVASDEVNRWLSEKLGKSVQLRWLGESSARQVKGFEPTPMSFADSNPLLLVSQQSLAEVQRWSSVAVSLEQFRGNVVIDGVQPFEEEQWQGVKIGEVAFEVAQCCTRCILITRDLATLTLDPNAEPFRTLKQHHTNAQGKPIFGVHLVPKNSGIIRVGDVLTPLI